MSDDASMCKAERLAVAGHVAPALRTDADKLASRRVTKIRQDTGEVTGYATLLDLAKGALQVAAIEIEVQPEERPRQAICKICGGFFKTPPRKHGGGQVPKKCSKCRKIVEKCKICKQPCKSRRGRCQRCYGDSLRKPRYTCADCGVELHRSSSAPYAIAKRKGIAAVCKPCQTIRLVARRREAAAAIVKVGCIDCGKVLASQSNAKRGLQKRCKPCDVAFRGKSPPTSPHHPQG